MKRTTMPLSPYFASGEPSAIFERHVRQSLRDGSGRFVAISFSRAATRRPLLILEGTPIILLLQVQVLESDSWLFRVPRCFPPRPARPACPGLVMVHQPLDRLGDVYPPRGPTQK